MVGQARRTQPPRERSARPQKVRTGNRLAGWQRHHRQVAVDSLRRLRATPIQTLLTTLVIAIALALPGVLYRVTQSLAVTTADLNRTASLSLYLRHGVDESAASALADKLRGAAGVDSMRYLSATEALAEFQQGTGLGDALALLDENPLPAVIVLTPDPELAANEIALQAWMEEIAADPAVDDAVLDLAWLQRLQELLAIAERAVGALGLVLALGVVLVMGNTIRLAIENRRDEIVVVKLIGASNAFVRRPFLYTGAWYGLFGGIAAWLLVVVGVFYLSRPVDRLAALYQSHLELHGPEPGETAILLLAATLLGWLGAWLAVGRQLSAIEPT